MNALFRRFPALEGRVPWRALGVFPTPVLHLGQLAGPGGADVWVKCDDVSGGAGADRYGGNKVRKLEYLLADAVARGRRAVLTAGGTGSNHVIATAIYARAVGIEHAHAVLFWQPPSDDVTRKIARVRELAVRTTYVGPSAFVPFGAVSRLVAALAGGGGRPYVIPPGGSTPLGSLGYVAAGLELGAQVAAGELPAPDAIYVALGSCGTVAGLLVGLRLAGLASTRVVAVRVVPWPWCTGRRARGLAGRTAALISSITGTGESTGESTRLGRFGAGDLDVVHDQLGAGYGAPTPAARDAVAHAAELGLELETTYTGKAFAALRAAAPAGQRRLLFWNTVSRQLGGAATTIAHSSANELTR